MRRAVCVCVWGGGGAYNFCALVTRTLSHRKKKNEMENEKERKEEEKKEGGGEEGGECLNKRLMRV